MRASAAVDSPDSCGLVSTPLSASAWLATSSVNAANSGALNLRCANMKPPCEFDPLYYSLKRREPYLAPLLAESVMAGLDPAIHLLRKNLLKRDGCAGQARA